MLILVATMAATPDFGTVDQSVQELTDARVGSTRLAAGWDARFYRNAALQSTQTARYPNRAAEIIFVNFS